MKCAALLVLGTGVLFGADLSGIWTGQIAGRFDEVQDITFRFSQSGSAVSGKIYGEIESQPVNEGNIAGDQITFMVGSEMNGGRNRFRWGDSRRGTASDASANPAARRSGYRGKPKATCAAKDSSEAAACRSGGPDPLIQAGNVSQSAFRALATDAIRPSPIRAYAGGSGTA
jgi:hypothetical protein